MTPKHWEEAQAANLGIVRRQLEILDDYHRLSNLNVGWPDYQRLRWDLRQDVAHYFAACDRRTY